MIKKKIIITSCNQCGHCDLGWSTPEISTPKMCRHNHNERQLPEDTSEIPEWCPLEDAG